MRIQWILSALSFLISMGLVVIIMGQYQELFNVESLRQRLQKQSEKFDGKVMNENYFKESLEKLLVQKTKALEELKPSAAEQGPELEKKRTEVDVCQSEKKTKNDELAANEKARTDTEATLKSESDAWNQEIITLKAQLAENSPVCVYVKESSRTLTEKLCGFGPTAVTAAVAKD